MRTVTLEPMAFLNVFWVFLRTEKREASPSKYLGVHAFCCAFIYIYPFVLKG
jgi:hypothetical protein